MNIPLQDPDHLVYLSLGAGVQSSALALMAERGLVQRPDVAIFADTHWEPPAVYDWLDWLEGQLSFPVLRVSAGNLREEVISMAEGRSNFLRIPAFTLNEDGSKGILRRQCTREYKIAPVQRAARSILGAEPRQRLAKGKRATVLIGISRDEISRAKPSTEKWVTKTFPLIDLSLTRQECIRWMEENGFPEPPRSACIGCPFHTDREWAHLKHNEPELFADAVEVDRLIRDSTGVGVERPAFLHEDLVPLDEVRLTSDALAGQDGVFNNRWNNECEGMCGV